MFRGDALAEPDLDPVGGNGLARFQIAERNREIIAGIEDKGDVGSEGKGLRILSPFSAASGR